MSVTGTEKVLVTSSKNTEVLTDCDKLLESCKTSLQDLSQSAYDFIVEHEEYMKGSIRDAKLLKERMKRKVKEVYNSEVQND